MINLNVQNEVALITFDDGKVNVLNHDSLTHLEKALEDAKDAKAVVLTGGAKCFSAGLDLKTLPTLSEPELQKLLEHFNRVLQTILRFPRPVVAAINGHAIAGGAVINLCCDYAVGVKKEIKVGLSEVAVGMPLPTFVVELARQRLCPKSLNEAVLFGKLYSFEGAKEAGYFHLLAEEEDLISTAVGVASQLAKLPGPAFADTKKALTENLPEKLGAEAFGSFLTAQAKAHMAQFKS